MFYNAAGLVDSTRSRANITARYRYDQLGRLKETIYPTRSGPSGGPDGSVPGDSMTYTYDIMGNLLTAQNRFGTITRSYYLDGLLKQKITSLASYSTTFSYHYSPANELTLVVRDQDSVFYRYNATTGLLDTLAVWWGSPANTRRAFVFTWDSLGRRHTIRYPTGTTPANSMTVTYRYDGTGQLRRVVSDHPGGLATGDAFDFTFRNKVVDPMGRVLRQELTCSGGTWPDGGNPCGSGSSVVTENRYNALSHLVRQASGGFTDSMRYDASGNMVAQRRQNSAYTKLFTIPASHNRLTASTCSPNGCNPKSYTYTNDGDREHDDATPNDASDRWYYYDGLGRMAGYQTFDPQTGTQIDHHDACGYDPDGNMARPCENFTTWLAYDGSNVAGELMSGGQGWRFVNGPGIDDPLIGYYHLGTQSRILYWVTDGQGRQLAVGDSTGSLVAADGYVDQRNYRYAGATKGGSSFGAGRLETVGGAGAGLSFFRNRAYDQATGRWTQEDPIGLAGGINLYQFNGNNPVTYTDPFGLDPCKRTGNCTQQQESRNQTLFKEEVANGSIVPTEASPLFLIGGIQREEAAAITITGKRLAHVIERHTEGGLKSAGKSIFAAGEDLVGLVTNAEGVQAVKQAVGRNFERILDAGRSIGIDRATGQPTSVYTVITNIRNELVTMFPGTP
jgi:YD repeat-containing protein